MKRFIVLLSGLIAFSCAKPVLLPGTIRQQGFTETLPFNFDQGLPIIKVSINGSQYNFLLDTGAPTVISNELAAQLKPKLIKRSKVGDSQGNEGRQDFVSIEEIKIGQLQFTDVGAIVIDLKKSFEVKCLGIEGIIGSNQMSNAIWEIDYKNKNITINDNFSGFREPKEAAKLPFLEMAIQKTPLVKVRIDSIESNLITFDTGANGAITLSALPFEKTIKTYRKIKSYGNPSSGIYGMGERDTIITAKVPFLKMGTLKLNDQIVTFEDKSSLVIGNGFLKNYKTTLNWKTKAIYLEPFDTLKNRSLEGFGFGIRYSDRKPVITIITHGTDAERSGMQVGDEILEIDGINLLALSEEETCYYIFNSILTNKKEITMVFLRNDERREIKLTHKTLLE